MRKPAKLVLGSLMLLSLAAWTPDASAEVQMMATVNDSGILTLDVLPLQAEIKLNGAKLGTAKDVLARAIPVLPGPQVLEVEAPGYFARTVNLSATPDWAVRVWLQLVPVRSQ